jgi:ElaA protein
MIWQLKKFDELTNTELYAIIQLRSEVFVVEQNCVYLDLDNSDQQSFHLFTTNNNIIAAYCRIIPPGIHYNEASIGRVITAPTERKNGFGKLLMQEAIVQCKNLYPKSSIKIGAQFYLKSFYENLGFTQISEIYDEDGIDHIKMLFA